MDREKLGIIIIIIFIIITVFALKGKVLEIVKEVLKLQSLRNATDVHNLLVNKCKIIGDYE